jgi:hypothetical protein
MKTEIIEYNKLIANRVKGKNDTWILINDPTQKHQPSLTDALNAYYVAATVKPQAFRLEPIKGNLYIITTEDIEIIPEPPKQFDLYGEYE